MSASSAASSVQRRRRLPAPGVVRAAPSRDPPSARRRRRRRSGRRAGGWPGPRRCVSSRRARTWRPGRRCRAGPAPGGAGGPGRRLRRGPRCHVGGGQRGHVVAGEPGRTGPGRPGRAPPTARPSGSGRASAGRSPAAPGWPGLCRPRPGLSSRAGSGRSGARRAGCGAPASAAAPPVPPPARRAAARPPSSSSRSMAIIPAGIATIRFPAAYSAAGSEPLVDLGVGAAGQRLPRVIARPGPGVHRPGMLARPRAVRAARAAALAVRPGPPRRDRQQSLLQVPVRGLAQLPAADTGLRRPHRRRRRRRGAARGARPGVAADLGGEPGRGPRGSWAGPQIAGGLGWRSPGTGQGCPGQRGRSARRNGGTGRTPR